jgi:superfamily II DNA helicase RecQ
MEISVDQIILIATTIGGFVTTCLQSRKARKAEERAQQAEIKAKEAEIQAKEFDNMKQYIENSNAMVELVMTANEKRDEVQTKLINDLKTENEKFKDTTELLQRAIKSISLCPYRGECPVYGELQNPAAPYRVRKGLNGNHPGGSKGHSDRDKTGSGAPESAPEM